MGAKGRVKRRKVDYKNISMCATQPFLPSGALSGQVPPNPPPLSNGGTVAQHGKMGA